MAENSIKVYKGTNPEVDSYSVFWDNKKLSDTTLNAQLKMKGTSDIYVCGLAYDVCVGATAIDAISAGYRTILIDDCCRGVDLKDIEHTKETVISSNGIIAHSKEVCVLLLSWILTVFTNRNYELGQSDGRGQRSTTGVGLQVGYGIEKL